MKYFKIAANMKHIFNQIYLRIKIRIIVVKKTKLKIKKIKRMSLKQLISNIY
jgi:hypothetical protein